MKASSTHICDLHNHYGAYMCRCRAFWVHTCACVCVDPRLLSPCRNEIPPVFLCDFIVFMVWIMRTHPLPPPSEQLDKIHLMVCQEVCFFFIFYARLAGFYLSPITSPVHVQWSPAVSAGCKHSKETQGSNCPCQVTGELPLLLWFHWLGWFAC